MSNSLQSKLNAYSELKNGICRKSLNFVQPSRKVIAASLPCITLSLGYINPNSAATATRVINITVTSGAAQSINIDNFGGNDIFFGMAADGIQAGDGAAPSVYVNDTPGNWFAKNPYGANIAAAGSFNKIMNGGYLGVTYDSTACTAPWFANGPGFLGVKFFISGALHMGWLALEVTDKQDANGGVCPGSSNQPGRTVKVIKAGWNTTSIAGGGTSIMTPASLAVELVKFQATPHTESIHLNWQTTSEINNAGFEVQRSTDGHHFQNLVFIEGKGTNSEKQEYYYDDKNLRQGQVYYYRLKQIDYSGSFSYSKIITAKINSESPMGTFHPNPVANGRTWLHYHSLKEGELLIQVFDMMGRKLGQYSYSVETGNNRIDIDFGELSAGTYFVRMDQDNQHNYKMIIKQ